MPTRLPSPVTTFDSSTVPLEALADFLNRRDYHLLGVSSFVARAVSLGSTLLPKEAREWTGSIPFWTVFNAEGSVEALERYLDRSQPFEDIYMVIFSHGVSSPGLAPMDRWLSALRRAKAHGRVLGVDQRAYPKDFQVFFRYHAAIEKIPSVGSRPAPLSVDELAEFLKSANFSLLD